MILECDEALRARNSDSNGHPIARGNVALTIKSALAERLETVGGDQKFVFYFLCHICTILARFLWIKCKFC